MLEQDRLDYYRRREAAERQRAIDAPNSDIASIHTRLADCYARIIEHAELRSLPASEPHAPFAAANVEEGQVAPASAWGLR